MNVFAKCLIVSSLFLLGGFAHAQNVHGVLRVVKGDVQIKSAKTGQTAKARLGGQVYPKDTIITGKDARAKIVMVDNNEINVSPESQIEIQNYEFDPAAGKKDVLLNVIYGKVRSKVEQKYDGKTTKFQIKTPSAVAGVRGTDFLTSFNRSNNSSSITTFEGRVEFGTPGPGGTIANAVMVGPGTQATSVAGGGPTAPKPVPKEELAKVEADSKADTAASKSDGGGDSRQPAEDKKEKKDDAKKEDSAGAKKEDGAAKKEDGSKKEGSSASAGGTKGGGGAAASGDQSSSSTSSNSGGGSASNDNPPAAAGDNTRKPSSSSGCTMCGPPPPPPPPLVMPTMPPTSIIPTIQPIPQCDACREAIQGGPVKVRVNVR